LKRALANLDAEAEYIARDKPRAAARVVESIHETVALFRQYPALGRTGRVAGTRELVVPDTPYIIPYRIRGKEVQILRVFHAARKWPKKF
jgi:addiction module RelE/StbE family toxin